MLRRVDIHMKNKELSPVLFIEIISKSNYPNICIVLHPIDTWYFGKIVAGLNSRIIRKAIVAEVSSRILDTAQ